MMDPDIVHTHRVLAGYKSTITNTTTSDEAKSHAKNRIAQIQYHAKGDHMQQSHETAEEHKARVVGGYKAALANPHTSAKARAHATDMIAELTGEPYKGKQENYAKHEDEDEDEHINRIIGGHKATISNPKTSEAAKEHSRGVLETYGVKV